MGDSRNPLPDTHRLPGIAWPLPSASPEILSLKIQGNNKEHKCVVSDYTGNNKVVVSEL